MSAHTRRALAAAAFACAALFGAAAAALSSAEEARAAALLWAALCSQGLWLSLALAGALAQTRVSVGARLGLGPGTLSAVGVLAAAVGFIALSHVIHHALWALDLRHVGGLGRIDEMAAELRATSVVLAVVALGIAPGIGEELLFRGFLQRSLADHVRPSLAVLGASAAFGLAHGDLIHGGAAFAMGLYLGIVAWAAGSIRPAVFCHVLNNALGVLVAPVAIETRSSEAAQPEWAMLVALLGLSAAALLLATRSTWARSRAKPTRNES
jgi:membrane protease YdiL (CAAX protease family)